MPANAQDTYLRGFIDVFAWEEYDSINLESEVTYAYTLTIEADSIDHKTLIKFNFSNMALPCQEMIPIGVIHHRIIYFYP